MNNVPGFRIDNMPYGVKDSGLGREGVLYAMEEMTEPRLLVYQLSNHCALGEYPATTAVKS